MQRQNGTGTTHQNRVGIGTDPSGTSTDPSGTSTTSSYSPDFLYSYIVKLKFVHQGYKNPIKLLTGVQIRMKLSEKRTVPHPYDKIVSSRTHIIVGLPKTGY